MGKQYLCIDLKSFYASVECVERGLDPLSTDLVVADPERTEKTICLAVSPSLKAKGVRNRCRVFEIPQEYSYIMAPPRMKLYIEYSARIYDIYLDFFSKDDVHVYSIDEAFMDVTNYLSLYKTTARELGERIRREIMDRVGIPATCGLGTNLFLAKVALDITAKHSPDFFGELDEESFKSTLWDHRPITDFWRIGKGTARRLRSIGVETMGQLALYPDSEQLYSIFGIDAEILIDHAWGIEPVEISDIKAYVPQTHSTTNAQVLPRGYTFAEARVIVTEMVESSCLGLVADKTVAASVTVVVRYESEEREKREGDTSTARFPASTNSRSIIMPAAMSAYETMAREDRRIRYITVVMNNVEPEGEGQLDIFYDDELQAEERRRQEAILSVKERFGRNALLKGIDLLPSATQQERNRQIGGAQKWRIATCGLV